MYFYSAPSASTELVESTGSENNGQPPVQNIFHLKVTLTMPRQLHEIKISKSNFPTLKGKIQQTYHQALHHWDRWMTPGVTGGRARPGRRAASTSAPPPVPRALFIAPVSQTLVQLRDEGRQPVTRSAVSAADKAQPLRPWKAGRGEGGAARPWRKTAHEVGRRRKCSCCTKFSRQEDRLLCFTN